MSKAGAWSPHDALRPHAEDARARNAMVAELETIGRRIDIPPVSAACRYHVMLRGSFQGR
jgi:hypothetical protein